MGRRGSDSIKLGPTLTPSFRVVTHSNRDITTSEVPPLKSNRSESQSGGAAVGRSPVTSGFENQLGLRLEEPRSRSESQCRGSSLNCWVIREGDTLTNFSVCAGGAEICSNFLQEPRCWWVPYFFPFFTLLPPIWSDSGRRHF